MEVRLYCFSFFTVYKIVFVSHAIFHESDTVLEASNYLFTAFNFVVKKNLKTSNFFMLLSYRL